MEVDSNIIILAAAASAFAKPLTDAIRKAAPQLPGWSLPLLAVLFSFVCLLLLHMSNGDAITPQIVARSVLAGILAGVNAVGITELQKSATPPSDVVWIDGTALFKGGEGQAVTQPEQK